MTIRGWIRKVIVDSFWKDWHDKFRLNHERYITPDHPLVQEELTKFQWSESDTDKEKAEKAWRHVYDITDYKLSAAWYTPEQTLTQKRGDCEDFTFLLASMFSAMGIEEHRIRTGVLVKGTGASGEHVWNEVNGMTVDATGLPEDVGNVDYYSNHKFEIVEA